jgi:hypothetical protein
MIRARINSIFKTVLNASKHFGTKEIRLPHVLKNARIPAMPALFLFILFLPSILVGVSVFTGIGFKGRLSGYVDNPGEKVHFSLQNYANRAYQKNIESQISSNINLRGYLIRLHNQINFSFFKLSQSTIVGENDNIFEMQYINAECGLDANQDFSLDENANKLGDYVNHLESIQNKLKKINKYFIFVITPSKASLNFQDIPLKYRLKKRDDFLPPYYYLKKMLKLRGVTYIDSRDYLSKDTIPDFYATGIHWSRPTEQRVSQALVKKMSELSKKRLKQINFSTTDTSDIPYKRDADVYNLTNLIAPPQGPYYEYKYQKDSNEDYAIPKFLIQGGSFSQGFYMFDYGYYSRESYKFFYNKAIQEKDAKEISIKKWEDVDFAEILDNVDFVIIELNEASVHNFSNGFADYLDSFLDLYTKSEGM